MFTTYLDALSDYKLQPGCALIAGRVFCVLSIVFLTHVSLSVFFSGCVS